MGDGRATAHAVMKVDPTGRVRPTKKVDKTRRSRASTASTFKDALKTATVTAPPVPALAAGIEAVDALLAIQEVDAVEREATRPQAYRRGEQLLDRLDEIRLGLLSGGLSEARLNEIAAMVAEKRRSSDDPGLEQVLDEIELRVKVELAKLGR